MNDSQTLSSCPFCGGEASWIAAQQREDGTYYPAACGCRKCGIWRYGESDYGHGGFATEQDRKVSMEQAVLKWNTRATHGTLTAEQVRETVEKHWHDLPDEYDMPEATAFPEYSYDWQAIADELNAEIGGTCNLYYGEDDDGYDGWYCDGCGGWFQAVRRDGRLVEPKHCQECGRRRTDDR